MIVWGGDAGGRLITVAPHAPPSTHKSRDGVRGSTPTPTPTPTATPIPSHGTGATYDPSTDNWTATSTSNAPSARGSHTAIWTGSEMIVSGGFDGIVHLKTGGQSRHEQLDPNEYHERSGDAQLSYRSVEWERDDRVGRI